MSETAAPYGAGGGRQDPQPKPVRRIRTHHLREMKERGEKWAMLTSYDMYTAATFDEAGIPVLLVGDSASNNVYGNETSLPVTVDELIPLVRAVTRSVQYALVVADLPFGSYQASPEQAYHTSVRFMKESRKGEETRITHWVSTLTFSYANAPMSSADRLINPLGFLVSEYRADPEVVP